MEIYEITGYQSGISREGVNYLQPSDSFEDVEDGFIYRQVLQSRQGIAPLVDQQLDSRIMAIVSFKVSTLDVRLLAFTQTTLYRLVSGTWTAVAFSTAASTHFGGSAWSITDNFAYISATAYPDALFNRRLVFCSSGLSAICFYDADDDEVKLFTDTTDNPSSGIETGYVAPSWGALQRARTCEYWNERINFWSPTIAGTEYDQSVIYSGNRESGYGSNFLNPGSKLDEMAAQGIVVGSSVLGKTMIGHFTDSTWAAEETRDPFNPTLYRKITGPLGTDAGFSPVFWDEEVTTIGRSAIIRTDGRQVKRIDTKIPFFAQEEIDPDQIDLVAGGFDRENGQFLWTYLSSEAPGDTQDRILVRNYEEGSWSVYKLNGTVFGDTIVNLGLTWDDIYEAYNDAWISWETTEDIWNEIGDPSTAQKPLMGSDEGYVYQMNVGLNDELRAITAITQANPAVLTVGNNGFTVGDQVVVFDVQGMTEINNYDITDPSAVGGLYEVTARTPTTITLNVDSTNFGTYTSGGLVPEPIRFKARTIPFNPYRSKGRRCFVSHVELLLDITGGFIKLNMYADEESDSFKTVKLVPSDNQAQKREWITAVVNQEANFITFEMEQVSALTQVKVTSMRIHCRLGGLTSA